MNPNLLYDVATQYRSERLASAERRRLIRILRPPTLAPAPTPCSGADIRSPVSGTLA